MYLPAKTILNARSLLSLLVILAASSALEAGIFVDLPGIDGESKSKNHGRWIVCESLSFGVTRPVSQDVAHAGRTQSAAKFSEITLRRSLDISSVDFFMRAANGYTEHGDVVIELTRSNGEEQVVFLRLVLKGVQVASYSLESDDEGTTEVVTLKFSSISMSYKLYDGIKEAGEVTRTWDVAANKES